MKGKIEGTRLARNFYRQPYNFDKDWDGVYLES